MYIDPLQQKDPVTLSMFLASMAEWFQQTTNMANSAWPSHVTQQFSMGKFMLDQLMQATEMAALVGLQTNRGPNAQLLRNHAFVESCNSAYLLLQNPEITYGTKYDAEAMIDALAPFRSKFLKIRFNWIIGKYFSVEDWNFKSKHVEQEFKEVAIDGAELKRDAQDNWRLFFHHQQKNGSHISYEISPKGVNYLITKLYNALEKCEHQGTAEHIDIDWMCDKLRELMLAAGWNEELYKERLMTREQFEEALTKHFQDLPTPETMKDYNWSDYSWTYVNPAYCESNVDGVKKWWLSTNAVPGQDGVSGRNLLNVFGVDSALTHIGERNSNNATPALECLHENSYRFIYEQIVKERTKAIATYLKSLEPKAPDED